MARIRRGGYIFITWIGDHSPRHVHVYRDGKLVVKWDLDNGIATSRGQAHGNAASDPAGSYVADAVATGCVTSQVRG